MTKKILIDEAVVKQVLEALENHPGNYKLSKAECVTYNAAEGALREALEVNNKGVNVLAEQQVAEPVAWGLGNTAITGSNRWMMLREQVPADDQYGGAMWTPLYTRSQARELEQEPTQQAAHSQYGSPELQAMIVGRAIGKSAP